MKCHPYNVRYESCATCARMGKCSVFESLAEKQQDQYLGFVLDHISRHPDKYKLGVIMSEVKTVKNIVLLDSPPDKDRWKTMQDINAMSDEEKLTLQGKSIYQVTKKYEVRFKVELKAVPFEGEIQEPEEKAKNKKPAKSGR